MPLLAENGFFWYSARLSSELIQSHALFNAAQYSKTLSQFRTLYTSEVVSRVKGHNIDVRHDYGMRDGAIPLPATLSMLLAKKMALDNSGLNVSLYSVYPFPWRRAEGGLKDDFKKDA